METMICNKEDCIHGGTPQPLDNFRRVKNGKRRSACKDCEAEYQRQYRKTEQGQAVYKNWNRSEGAKAASQKYEQSEHGKLHRAKYRKRRIDWYTQYWREYNHSKRGKLTVRRYARSEKASIKRGAQLAIKYAIARGDLPAISDCKCMDCGDQATAYHHTNGYDVEDYFDVVPLCHQCHKTRHHPTSIPSHSV